MNELIERKPMPEPQVVLIDYTGAGAPDAARHAANVLVFTKQTRLRMDQNLMAQVEAMSDDQISDELDYMANTIPSSWEFIEYKFLINNVTRAFTHQFVRTRTGSYAQQTMRVLDVDGWTFSRGPTIEDNGKRRAMYNATMDCIADSYEQLIKDGAKIEDARGVLPTNIHTNIVAKFDLRTLADTARKRASSRTQGEYRTIMNLMLAEVLRVHPWASKFLTRSFDVAAAELEEHIKLLGNISEVRRTTLIKLIDQMRMTA